MMECIFCKIIERKLSARIVYEDDLVCAFEDITPQAPVHVLVIPKKHIATLLDLHESDNHLMGHLLKACSTVAGMKGIAERGFRVVTNCNAESGQTVYHIHFHVLGGRRMHWPPG